MFIAPWSGLMSFEINIPDESLIIKPMRNFATPTSKEQASSRQRAGHGFAKSRKMLLSKAK